MTTKNGKSPYSPDQPRSLDGITDAEIAAVLPHVTGFRAAGRTLGLSDNANTANRIRLRVASFQGDVAHFVRSDTSNYIRNEILFSRREKKLAPSALIARAVSEGLLPNHCAVCKQGPDWHGGKLLFRLQQLNGDKFDSRIENLRILCPNCHSILPSPPSRIERRQDQQRMRQYKAIVEEEARDAEDQEA